jgi:hypothetical protein
MGAHEVHDIWMHTYRNVPVGSAQQANAIAEIRASFTSNMAEAMRVSIAILANPESE